MPFNIIILLFICKSHKNRILFVHLYMKETILLKILLDTD